MTEVLSPGNVANGHSPRLTAGEPRPERAPDPMPAWTQLFLGFIPIMWERGGLGGDLPFGEVLGGEGLGLPTGTTAPG